MFLSLPSYSDPPKRFLGLDRFDTEAGRRIAKIPQVEGDDSVRATIHSGFQNHLVAWVAQLRTPQEPKGHRLGQRGKPIEKDVCLRL